MQRMRSGGPPARKRTICTSGEPSSVVHFFFLHRWPCTLPVWLEGCRAVLGLCKARLLVTLLLCPTPCSAQAALCSRLPPAAQQPQIAPANLGCCLHTTLPGAHTASSALPLSRPCSEPQFSNADRSCLWELTSLATHVHPSGKRHWRCSGGWAHAGKFAGCMPVGAGQPGHACAPLGWVVVLGCPRACCSSCWPGKRAARVRSLRLLAVWAALLTCTL